MRWPRSAPDFAPKSLLDVGAGPGTASWAAAEAFSSLQSFTLLDANTPCARWRWISAAAAAACATWHYRRGEARAALAEADAADLVVASYMIGEISESERGALAELMWAKTRDTLLVVEPGTPAGYARIHRAAGAIDRRRARMSRRPARMTAHVRS